MAQQTKESHHLPPLTRLFLDHPNATILDYFMSNYKIDQSLKHVIHATGLGEEDVKHGLEQLVNEKLIKPHGDNYVTDFNSDRLIGLYSYYRATMGSNLNSMFSNG